MHLIADIGGTSSRWVMLREGMDSLITYNGFNPVVNQNDFPDLSDLKGRVSQITAYGAGCGNEDRKSIVQQHLKRQFPNAQMAIHSDLLAVGHALLGHEDGLIAILGTGMNVGEYQEALLTTQMPSLGYLFGDEGSGAYIGKRVVSHFHHGRFPEELVPLVFPEGAPVLHDTITRVYNHATPNKVIASYAGRLYAAKNHPFVQKLLAACFDDFIDVVLQYHSIHKMQRMALCGGIAFNFKETLAERLQARGINSIRIEADPLKGLLEYHRAR